MMSTNLTKYRDLVYIALIIIFCGLWLRQCKETRTVEDSIINLQDTIKREVKKDGSKVFTTGAISVDPKTFKKLKTKDVAINKIKEEIDNKTITSTYLETATNLNSTFKDSTTISNPWIQGYIYRLNSDSIKLNLNFKNEYIVTVKEQGFFKRNLVVDVLSYNPNDEITVLKSYVKPMPRKNIVIGPVVGFGLGFNTKTFDIDPTYFVGIGAQYKLIEL